MHARDLLSQGKSPHGILCLLGVGGDKSPGDKHDLSLKAFCVLGGTDETARRCPCVQDL